MWIKNLFNKRKNYVMFFMGGTPIKIVELFEKVVDAKTAMTAIFSPEFVSIRFDSVKNMKELKTLMTKYCDEGVCGYFLFNADDDFHHKIRVKSVGKEIYRQYVVGEGVMNFIVQLGDFYDLIRSTKDQILQQISSFMIESDTFEVRDEIEENVSEDDINNILEKIKISGLESLTEAQRKILEKYSK